MQDKICHNTGINSILFRTANNEDGESIRALIFETLQSYGLEVDINNTDSDLFDIEKYYPEGNFWVLVDQSGKIKGSFALYKIDTDTAELRKMYFDPSIRRLGLGIWAINFLLDTAKTKGFKILTLETASVLKEAVRLYEKMGFEHVQGQLHSHRCNVMMQKIV